VYIVNDSVLLEEQIGGGKVTNGHIVVVDWGIDPNQIVGRVTLFNTVRYSIVLSHKYVGLWFPLGTGHHFDVTGKKISKLVRLTRNDLVDL